MDSSWVVFSHPLVEKGTYPHSPPESPSLNTNKWRRSVYISLHHPPSLFSTSCHQPLLNSKSTLWMENLAHFLSPKIWSHYCFNLKEFPLWYQPLPTAFNSHLAHLTRSSTWHSHVLQHTSQGPQHDILMLPPPGVSSTPPTSGIIIKEKRLDYTDNLFQDSQDPWEEFMSLLFFPEISQKTPSTHLASSSSAPPNKTPVNSRDSSPHNSPTRQPRSLFNEVDIDVDNLSPSHSFWKSIS